MNFFNRKMLKNKPKGYSPVAQSFLRGAGSFPRQKMMMQAIVIIIAGSAVLGFLFGILVTWLAPIYVGVWSVIGMLLIILLVVTLLRWNFDAWERDLAIGEMAERQVDETLSRLGRPQWRIIHGFKKEGGGDIDHIVVCPKGVFIIETKGLRAVKKLNLHRGEKPKLTYDGTQIRRDDGMPLTKPNPVEQARRHAKNLHNYIVQKIGMNKKSAFVTPFVVLPGWSVDFNKAIRRGANVYVVELEALEKRITEWRNSTPLSSGDINKIADRIEADNRVRFGDPDSPD